MGSETGLWQDGSVRVAPDPYLPAHGDRRYSVTRYDLQLDYRVRTNRLSGRATLTLRALAPLDSIRLDLSGLNVKRVLVDQATPRKVDIKDKAVLIKLHNTLGPETTAVIEVSYSGKPRPVQGVHGPAGWEELTDGAFVASQPYGASSFFPCNDRADDKAAYGITVTTEDAYHVVATGRATGRSTRAGRTTWVFDEATPTSPYLVGLAIGRFAETTLSGAGAVVTLVHPRLVTVPQDSPFRLLPEMTSTLEGWFGPYPLEEFRAVVVDDHLEIPLEAQGMATFGTNHLGPGWDNERLVVHELAHQWFGNAVTVAQQRDIWLHEGFACYTEWLWSEHRGQGTAQQRARDHWVGLERRQPSPLSDPGPEDMFDDWVYKRGALTLHALRCRLGSEAFFVLCREWIASHAGRCVSTSDFVTLSSRYASDLAPLFNEWLDELALPPLPNLP